MLRCSGDTKIIKSLAPVQETKLPHFSLGSEVTGCLRRRERTVQGCVLSEQRGCFVPLKCSPSGGNKVARSCLEIVKAGYADAQSLG